MEKHRSYIIVTLRLHARVHLYYNLAASLFHGIKTQMQLWKGLIAPYFLKCARRLNIMYWAICIDDSAPLPSPHLFPPSADGLKENSGGQILETLFKNGPRRSPGGPNP